jgi:hypothetical protein
LHASIVGTAGIQCKHSLQPPIKREFLHQPCLKPLRQSAERDNIFVFDWFPGEELFGSLQAVKQADPSALSAVVTRVQAEAISNHFRK